VTRRRLLKIFVPVLAMLGVSAVAFAYWTTAGAGSASGSVATLNAPTNVAATGGTNLANVSWTGSTLSTGTPAQGYYVQRYSGSSSPAPACGTDPANSATYIAHTSGTITCTDSGVAPGTYTYKVTAVYHSWTAQSAASGSATVVALDHFVVSAPASATAGSPFSVTVTAKDSSGNTVTSYTGTIHFTSSDSQAVLPPNYTFTSGDAGSHTFSSAVTSKTAGGQSVSVSDTVQTVATGSATVAVSAASRAKLVFTQQPSNSTGGAAFATQPKVAIQDAFGNVVTTDSSTVGLSITSGTPTSGGPGTLSGCGQSETNGVVSFSGCKIDTSGTGYKLHATDGTLTAADSNAFDVSVGTASQIVLSGAATSLASGSTRTLTATIEDAGGNTVTTGPDSSLGITFAQTAGSGTVTGTGSSTASAGVATKTVTGAVAGTVSLQASAPLSGPGATTSNTVSFSVTFGPASQIALTGSTAALASGTSRTLTATVQDAAGNTVTSGTDSSVGVAFSQPSGSGSVTGLGSSTASGGVATKTVTGNIAGPVDLRASATLSGPGTTNSNLVSFTVTFGSPSQLAFTTQPSGASGGTAFTTQPVVTAQDAAGNTVTSYAGTVTLSIKPATGTSGATLSGCSKALSNGATSFSGCKIDKSGTGYRLTATDGTLSADSNQFNVAVGSAARLVLTASVTSITSGGTSNLTVTAADAGGNTVTSYTGDHSLTFGGAGASPGGSGPTVTNKTGPAVNFGTAETITFSNGVAQISGSSNGVMTLYKAETASVTVSDGTINNNASPLSVTVNVGPSARLAWTGISTISTATPVPSPCYFTCTYSSGFGNNNTWNANVSITDNAGNIVSNVGTGHNVTVALGGSGDGSITSGTTLTMPATGPATSLNQVLFKGGHTGTWTNTLTATSTGFTNATASFTK
jgi:hypothetical protein